MMKKLTAIISAMAVFGCITPFTAGAGRYDDDETGVVYSSQLTDEELDALGFDDTTGHIIKVYHVPLAIAFSCHDTIDEILASRENLGHDYVKCTTDGKRIYYNADFSEKEVWSWSSDKRQPVPPVNLPQNIYSVYNIPWILNDIGEPDAVIERVYCLSSDLEGTAVYYVTDRGNFVYFNDYRTGVTKLWTGEDFAAYQKELYEADLKSVGEAVPGDVNGDGELTVADVVTVQKWLLSDTTSVMRNWMAADLCADGVINVYDFCLMKQALLSDEIPYFTPDFDPETIASVTVRDYTPYGWHDQLTYTSPEKIGALADYFNSLHLQTDFPEDPDEYSGMPWYVDFTMTDGSTRQVCMFGNMFYREDGDWMKMDYFEAEAFTRMIYDMPSDEFVKDPLDGVSVPPKWFSIQILSDENVYEHGKVISMIYDLEGPDNASFSAEYTSVNGVQPVGEPVCVKSGSVTRLNVSFVLTDTCRPGVVEFEINDGQDHIVTRSIHCWTDGEKDYVSPISLESLISECPEIREYIYH